MGWWWRIISLIYLPVLKKQEKSYEAIDIDHNGISVQNEFTPYTKITSFYINEKEEDVLLLIKLKGFILNPTKVVIVEPEIDCKDVEVLLAKYLKMEKIKLTSFDEIINAF